MTTKTGPKAGRLSYANSWEDPQVLLPALGDQRNGKLLTIAAAGDNCLSLLTLRPREIVAVDHNPLQLACLDLKRAGFYCLSYTELLAFLGVTACGNRLAYYARIRPHMLPEFRKLMDKHTRDITRGIIFSGKLEFFFGIFKKWLLPLLWRKSTLDELLVPSTDEERATRVTRELERFGWKLILRFFFSKPVISLLGRDREKFKYVQGTLKEMLRQRMQHVLIDLPTWKNPFINYILHGNYDHVLPHYLRPENYVVIKEYADRIVLVESELSAYLKQHKAEKYTGFALSDIFEYLDTRQTGELFHFLVKQAHPGARLAYWNMMVDRRSSHRNIRHLAALSQELFARDQVMFYKNFIVEEVV